MEQYAALSAIHEVICQTTETRTPGQQKKRRNSRIAQQEASDEDVVSPDLIAKQKAGTAYYVLLSQVCGIQDRDKEQVERARNAVWTDLRNEEKLGRQDGPHDRSGAIEVPIPEGKINHDTIEGRYGIPRTTWQDWEARDDPGRWVHPLTKEVYVPEQWIIDRNQRRLAKKSPKNNPVTRIRPYTC